MHLIINITTSTIYYCFYNYYYTRFSLKPGAATPSPINFDSSSEMESLYGQQVFFASIFTSDS